MHIAICDDDKDELLRISSILDTYQQERKSPITYKTFTSATELLSTTKKGEYTAYLLDVIMPGFSGMEAAKEIRSFDTVSKIIFLTSSPEFAVESYSVKAQDYILKPINKSRLYTVLDELVEAHQKPEKGLTIKTKNGISSILFSKLVFVEVMNKWVYFHLSDGSVREVTARLSEFEQILLARPEFVRVHRSFIVNLYHINELTAHELTTLQGNHIPISRSLYKQVRDTYVNQLFTKNDAN